ncbi:MAG: hypothetical protein IPP85_11795 [Propionivibrio sp.]|nr:hypothetical protein [Propionivibrio sp.]
MPHSEVITDVLIVGGGPVGMTLALALADSALLQLFADRQPPALAPGPTTPRWRWPTAAGNYSNA